MSDKYENATVLIGEIAHALLRGVKHFDMQGAPLLTIEDVLRALLRDGRVEFEPPDSGGKENT